jgi:hypothetical protein
MMAGTTAMMMNAASMMNPPAAAPGRMNALSSATAAMARLAPDKMRPFRIGRLRDVWFCVRAGWRGAVSAGMSAVSAASSA